MDLNYLFYRHQVSLVRAREASCSASRHAHQELARNYARLIEKDRADRPLGTSHPARLVRPAHTFA